jgi:hypothetical protein
MWGLRRRRLMRTPWYHDFSELGIQTPQRDGIYPANQPPKVQVLFPCIRRAVALCKAGGSCRAVELFCADGLYGDSRFSFAWLQRSLRGAGFEVLMADRNELVGNPHPNDRGSAYFLCR